MATTMKDIARQAGVDVSTVSLAINQDPRIRAETRARIIGIAQALGYRKNHLARGLRSGKSLTIGAVVGHATAFWGEVLAGAQSVFAERDYHLLLDYAPDERRREEMQIESLKAKRVDGLLIAPADRSSSEGDTFVLPAYHALREEKIPFVFVDHFVPGIEADVVAADNVASAQAATRHLLRLGHRKIAYLYAPHRMNTAQHERLEGCQSALRAAGLDPLLWQVAQPRAEKSEEGWETTSARLHDPDGQSVTALLAATDTTAMGALRALHDAGRRVPQDMTLISFGGTFTADYLTPPLSTMTLPMRDLGSRAAHLLLSRIEGDAAPFQRVLLPTELVVRASCGPKPNA